MNAHADPKTMTQTQAAQSPPGPKPVLHLMAPEGGAHGGAVHVPSAALLTQGDYARIGLDLMITGPDGEQVLVQDYFLTDSPPDLLSNDGAQIAGDLAERLAGSMAPGQYAQAGAGGVAKQSIGQVDTLNGTVNVIHADGSKGLLHKGDAVFQGDVLQTAKGGTVGVLFLDKTSLSLGGDGRMVLDQMVFDPSSGTGKSAFSLVQGTFSFVSGQIAKSSPDAMVVRTPVATIGIRGTLGSGGYTPQQGLTVAVLSEGANGTGEVTITNAAGSQTINTANSAIMVTSFFSAPPAAFSFTPLQFASSSFVQALSALPVTTASPGAAQAVQQIQNMAPAPVTAPLGGPQGGPTIQEPAVPQSIAPGGVPGTQGSDGPSPNQAQPGTQGGQGAAGPGGGVAFGLLATGETPPGALTGPQGPSGAAQLFAAAAQAAINQALASGETSIEQAHAAAMNVQVAFNAALSQGANAQQALATAGQAAVQAGLLAAPAAGAGGPGNAGGQNINPFAAVASGQAQFSSIGTLISGGGQSQGQGQGQGGAGTIGGLTGQAAQLANQVAANATAAGIAAAGQALAQGGDPAAAAAQAVANQLGGGSFGPTSFFGNGGVGTMSGGANQIGTMSNIVMGLMSGGSLPGGGSLQQLINQTIAQGGGNLSPEQIAAQVAAQIAAALAAQAAAASSSSNNTTNVVTTTQTDTTVFTDFLVGTSSSQTLTGGTGNTEFIFAYGGGSSSYVSSGTTLDLSGSNFGGTDTLIDTGGTDRVTFLGLDDVLLKLHDDSMFDGYVEGYYVANYTSATLPLNYSSDVMHISTLIDQIQATDDSSTELSNGVILYNAMTAIANSTQYGYIAAGTSSNDTLDLSSTTYYPSPIGSIIFGKGGTDTITGTAERDVIYGGANDDILTGAQGADLLYGGTGNDTLVGGMGGDSLDGGDGTDMANYSGTANTIYANIGSGFVQQSVLGDDSITSIEMIWGSTGDDTLVGGSGADTLWGSTGNDTLAGMNGADVLNGEGGTGDWLSYADETGGSGAIVDIGNNSATDTWGNSDTISNFENIIGSSYNDQLTGSTGANTFIGGGGNDQITGNGGLDVASYSTSTSSIVANLDSAASHGGVSSNDVSGTSSGTDTLSAVTAIIGTNYADVFYGSTTTASSITGGQGNDTIELGSSNTQSDQVFFGSVNSTGTAGLSRVSALGKDTITNFEVAYDTCYLSNSDFGLGSSGNATFFSNSGAGYASQSAAITAVASGSNLAGVFIVGTNSAGNPVDVYYIEANATTSANSYQIATITPSSGSLTDADFSLTS